MYVRLSRSGNRQYLRLVEAYRDEQGKARQRQIAQLPYMSGWLSLFLKKNFPCGGKEKATTSLTYREIEYWFNHGNDYCGTKVADSERETNPAGSDETGDHRRNQGSGLPKMQGSSVQDLQSYRVSLA